MKSKATAAANDSKKQQAQTQSEQKQKQKQKPVQIPAKIERSVAQQASPPKTEPSKSREMSAEFLPKTKDQDSSSETLDPHDTTEILTGVTTMDGSGEPIEAEFGTKNGPMALDMIKPAYPLRAQRLRKEGRVLLKLEISRTGELISARILESAGYGFDESALEAVNGVQFAPAFRNGTPVTCLALLPVDFRLRPRL